ncbi:MAG: hypothetical protein HEQ23_07785 [Tepidisphaera sp.]
MNTTSPLVAQLGSDALASAVTVFGTILAVTLAGFIAILVIRWVMWPAFKGAGWFISATFSFVGRTIREIFRLIGAVVTAIFYIPLILGTILIGRWSASAHFSRSLQSEFGLAGKCLYRLAIGNLLTSYGMRDVVAGIEERMPQAMADAPGSDLPHADRKGLIFAAEVGWGKNAKERTGLFGGYTIIGSLPGGGSGGKLYIAEPDAIKMATFERNGHFGVGQVVIKSFSIRDGSSLPQIVRESQSLPAAKKLGLVLDHELTPDRFYYAMRFVPGQSLSAVTHQLHGASAPPVGQRGLDDASLRTALGIVADLLSTLDAYHRGGLWHKDVKPDNIIVDGKRAHLVDFGLVTPLRSAMTLTTHGTEYFRDPEMVKMALKGVKVHEVDGARFDLFGAGAVLYSIIENSFPAHGVLSQISMRCPDALRWVVRRAMTDYDKRYPTAAAMLRDIDAIRHAADPMTLKPGQLPSMSEPDGNVEIPVAEAMPDFPFANRAAAIPAAAIPAAIPAAQVAAEQVAASAVPPPLPFAAPMNPAPAADPAEVRVTNWWTGAFEIVGGTRRQQPAQQAAPFAAASPGAGADRARRHDGARRTAAEQLENARGRAAAARERAQKRLDTRRPLNRTYSNNPSAGTYAALGVAALVAFVVLGGLFTARSRSSTFPTPPFPSDMSVVFSDRDPSGETRSSSPVRIVSDKPAKVSGATALVVVDLKKPLDASHEKEIKATVARLREAGFEVRGEYPGGEPDDTDLELTASAIKAASGLAVDTTSGAEAVGRWIAQSEGAADVVIWIKPAPGARGDVPNITRVIITPAEGVEASDQPADPTQAALIRKAAKEAAR